MAGKVLDIQNYHSTLTDTSSRRHETFSYLTEMKPAELKGQLQYIIDQGWDVGIEHVEPERSNNTYWYFWKLPMFGEWDLDKITKEIDSCVKKYPKHLIKVIGYNKLKQTQGTAMIVRRPS